MTKREFYRVLSLYMFIALLFMGVLLWISSNPLGVFFTSWIFSIGLMTLFLSICHYLFDLELFNENYPISYLLLWASTISFFSFYFPKLLENICTKA